MLLNEINFGRKNIYVKMILDLSLIGRKNIIYSQYNLWKSPFYCDLSWRRMSQGFILPDDMI